MKITIQKQNFSEIKIDFNEKQKDYNIYEDENITTFIYGYPYSFETGKWIYAENIKNDFLSKQFDFIKEIDGFYSIIIIDKKENKIYNITDRYGVYTLFYSKLKDQILISDDIKEITNSFENIELDKQSIFEYLNFGYRIGNKTKIKNIFEFEGANKYTINNSIELEKEEYWHLLDAQKEISDESFYKLFNKQHKNLLINGGKILLPLTGGRDTRTILSAYIDNLDEVKTYTHGPKYHTDIKLAKKVCKDLKISHKTYFVDSTWYKNMIPKIDGTKNIFNGLNSFFDYIHVIDSLKEEQDNDSVFMSGILGNQLYRNHPIGNAVPSSKNIKDISKFIFSSLPSAFNFKTDLSSHYKNVFKDVDIQEVSSIITGNIEKELYKFEKADKTIDYLQSYIFNSYSGNMASNSMKLTGKHLKVVGSFFNKDLLQQIKFKDVNERTSASIQKFIVRKNSSYLDKLPFYNSGRIIKYAKLILNKISSKLLKKNIFDDPNLVNYPYWLRKYHSNFLLETFDYDKMKLKNLFNEKELNNLVKKFIENKSSFRNKKTLLFNFALDRFIINLLSLELWLKDFDEIDI